MEWLDEIFEEFDRRVEAGRLLAEMEADSDDERDLELEYMLERM